jgi:hypothetical protein
MIFIILPLVILFGGCKKMIEVSEPVDTITSSEVFSTQANATSALIQIYSSMLNRNLSFANGMITAFAGIAADELSYYSADPEIVQFNTNTVLQTNGTYNTQFWQPAYSFIYNANAVIEGVQDSKTLSDTTRQQLIGEAKFLRAFCYFYLVNLVGDVPLVTTTSWEKTNLIDRTPSGDVYKQIVSDLKDAQTLLKNDYSISAGERIRVNKSAATALLARVYLYLQDWSNAESSASEVIVNTDLYSLAPTPIEAFGKNNSEAIWQLQISNILDPYATIEGSTFIPVDNASAPDYYLTSSLLSAYSEKDLRKSAWTDSAESSGIVYYYPKKYTVRQGVANGTVDQYYTVLRLAELYLIRAEARARLNNLDNAIQDLNTIRIRAGLDSFSGSTQGELLDAITTERELELFAEWGHRWLDLKRTKAIDNVLSAIKPQWQSTQQLWPIPKSEIQSNPNLTQNLGY